MLTRLRIKGVAHDKALLFTNWVDTESIFPVSSQTSIRKELGIPMDSIVALYSGNMGEKQGLEVILEAAKILAAENNICFLLCGDGAARSRLQDSYDNLANVRWLHLQPVEKLNELLNTADIHLLPQRADAADLVMPSKLTGMLASGRPVITTAHAGTQLAEIVSKCGIVVAPGDADAFAEALSALASGAQERAVLGASGRAYAEASMSKNMVLTTFENELHALMHK
jgi:putative colanic acid biosynthesis glycosyltransferase WcaI